MGGVDMAIQLCETCKKKPIAKGINLCPICNRNFKRIDFMMCLGCSIEIQCLKCGGVVDKQPGVNKKYKGEITWNNI